VCQALESADAPQSDFVSQFSKLLKLSIVQQFVLAVSLSQAVDPAIRKEGMYQTLTGCSDDCAYGISGIAFIKAHLKEVAESKEKLPMHVMHSFLYLVKSNSDSFIEQSAHVDALRRIYEAECDSLLAPLFLTESSLQTVDSRW